MYVRLTQIGLSAGMSTPAIRGMVCCLRCWLLLTLLLLVLGVGADHPQDALAADDLAVLADAPHAASHFHDCNPYRPAKPAESAFIPKIPRKLKRGRALGTKGHSVKRHGTAKVRSGARCRAAKTSTAAARRSKRRRRLP